MARAYTVATAALALGISAKWLDNTLSHYRVSGVVQRKQGVARRITIDGLLIISVALSLIEELNSSVESALDVAHKIVSHNGSHELHGGLKIELHLETLRDQLLTSLEHAVEIAPLPRRGRPPKNTTGRLE